MDRQSHLSTSSQNTFHVGGAATVAGDDACCLSLPKHMVGHAGISQGWVVTKDDAQPQLLQGGSMPTLPFPAATSLPSFVHDHVHAGTSSPCTIVQVKSNKLHLGKLRADLEYSRVIAMCRGVTYRGQPKSYSLKMMHVFYSPIDCHACLISVKMGQAILGLRHDFKQRVWGLRL
jgi:hypothetical protein